MIYYCTHCRYTFEINNHTDRCPDRCSDHCSDHSPDRCPDCEKLYSVRPATAEEIAEYRQIRLEISREDGIAADCVAS